MITLTPNAIRAIERFISTSPDPVAGLRIHVEGGGCSGMQYGMKLEAAADADDFVVEMDDVTLFIDPFSAPLLDSVNVDFVESLAGSGFKFDNPNAVGGCACGKSFNA